MLGDCIRKPHLFPSTVQNDAANPKWLGSGQVPEQSSRQQVTSPRECRHTLPSHTSSNPRIRGQRERLSWRGAEPSRSRNGDIWDGLEPRRLEPAATRARQSPWTWTAPVPVLATSETGAASLTVVRRLQVRVVCP